MVNRNSNDLWASLDEVAAVIQKGYSVTGKEAILNQYLSQVKQYPFYRDWFEEISRRIPRDSPVHVIEYGSGPGFLTELLLERHTIPHYVVVEPEKIFREMTAERSQGRAEGVDSIAEEFHLEEPVDFAVMTATYHHMHDKLRALTNIAHNLKSGGKLIIGEVFIPDYSFDTQYNPTNKLEFVEKVMAYAAEQVRFMPNPQNADVADQIKTAFLDILRIEELKVCVPILLDQLEKVGFKNILTNLMTGKDAAINYETLGYYLIEATKP